MLGGLLRVPPEHPAKHQHHHYPRGEPGGQADQHPPPRAHPNPKRQIPTRTRAVPSAHHTEQPRQPVTAQPATGPYLTRSCRGEYHADRRPAAPRSTPAVSRVPSTRWTALPGVGRSACRARCTRTQPVYCYGPTIGGSRCFLPSGCPIVATTWGCLGAPFCNPGRGVVRRDHSLKILGMVG